MVKFNVKLRLQSFTATSFSTSRSRRIFSLNGSQTVGPIAPAGKSVAIAICLDLA
jgi:hypothetical protein